MPAGTESSAGRWVRRTRRVPERGPPQRLVDAQMPARLAVVVTVVERRLADEEVAVPRELRQALARAAVAGIGDRLSSAVSRNPYVSSV